MLSGTRRSIINLLHVAHLVWLEMRQLLLLLGVLLMVHFLGLLRNEVRLLTLLAILLLVLLHHLRLVAHLRPVHLLL